MRSEAASRRKRGKENIDLKRQACSSFRLNRTQAIVSNCIDVDVSVCGSDAGGNVIEDRNGIINYVVGDGHVGIRWWQSPGEISGVGFRYAIVTPSKARGLILVPWSLLIGEIWPLSGIT